MFVLDRCTGGPFEDMRGVALFWSNSFSTSQLGGCLVSTEWQAVGSSIDQLLVALAVKAFVYEM